MTLTELAMKLRPYIEKAAMSLDDEDALEAKELFPRWNADAAYLVDDRVLYEEILYRCLQAHSAQAAWNPSAAPSLWAKVLIPEPGIIPEWEQPSSTNAYQIGDKVRHFNKIWESTIANNVWEPGVVGTENLWVEVTT